MGAYANAFAETPLATKANASFHALRFELTPNLCASQQDSPDIWTKLGTFCAQILSLQANGSTPARASSAAAAASGRTTLRRYVMRRCARRWPSHGKTMKRRTAGSRHERPATRLLWKRKHVVAHPHVAM